MASYDRVDWHLDSAIEAGQPEEHAFTHIGLYLAWVIRHDLHEPETFPADHIDAVRSGEMTGSDLADDIDGKLTSADMNAEGVAFSDARYEAYIGEYTTLFEDVPNYGVEDGPEAYAMVEALLDRMYAEWVADKGPAASVKSETDDVDIDLDSMEQVLMVPPGFTQEQVAELLDDIPGKVRLITPDSLPKSHVSTELESLIPGDLTYPPMDIESDRATSWGSSLLARALKRLGVSPKECVVVHGLGGEGQGTMTVSIYVVPGIDAERLTSEFRSVIFRIPGSDWESRTVAERDVHWASGEEFTVAFWARDGMVMHVTGQPEIIGAAIKRLP